MELLGVASLVGRPLFDFFWQETYSPQTYVTATEERTFFLIAGCRGFEHRGSFVSHYALLTCTTHYLPNIYVMKWVRNKKKAEKRTLWQQVKQTESGAHSSVNERPLRHRFNPHLLTARPSQTPLISPCLRHIFLSSQAFYSHKRVVILEWTETAAAL